MIFWKRQNYRNSESISGFQWLGRERERLIGGTQGTSFGETTLYD